MVLAVAGAFPLALFGAAPAPAQTADGAPAAAAVGRARTHQLRPRPFAQGHAASSVVPHAQCVSAAHGARGLGGRGRLQRVTAQYEALRQAQEKYGHQPLTGEQVRWGFEHLNLDDTRQQALGAKGLVQPLKLSCSDHEGGGAVRFQQWDGQKWKLISDWVQADRAFLRPIIEASSHQYAKEKGITPRDCSQEG